MANQHVPAIMKGERTVSIKKEDLEEMLEEGRFVPVVLTTMDGFSIAR